MVYSLKKTVIMNKEGIIKFKYYCEDGSEEISDNLFDKINPVRNKLAEMGLIGQYDDGLCYGNISIRESSTDEFFITASGTSNIKTINKEHYVKIIACDTNKNLCRYKGKGLPSSETLTHAIIYNLCKEAKSVIHIHNKKLWEELIGKVPSTSKHARYGTIEMVEETKRLFDKGDAQKNKIIVMEGHEEGIISFGVSVNEAMDILMKVINSH